MGAVTAGGPAPSEGGVEEFEAFVAARGAPLARLAFHVCRDAQTATSVAVSTLVGLGRSWAETSQEGRPGAAAQAEVVRRAVAASKETSSTAPPALWLEGPGAVDEAVAQAFGALPADARAALALVVADGVEPRDVDSMMGLGAGTTARRVTTGLLGLERARSAAADEFDVDLPSGRVEAHLRRLLLTSADTAGLPDSLVEPVQTARGRQVARRRLLIGGGSLVLLAGATAVALQTRDTVPAAARIPTGTLSTAPPGAGPSWDDVFRWPARGALARDPSLGDFARSNQTGMGPLHLIYADHLGKEDVAIFTSGAGESTGLVLATRPDGQWVTSDQGGYFGPSTIVSLAEFSSAQGYLLVLATPSQTSVQVSRTVTFLPEGGASRTDWIELPLAEGVGLGETGPSGGYGTAIQALRTLPPSMRSFDLGFLQTSGKPTMAEAETELMRQISDQAARLAGVALDAATTRKAWSVVASSAAARSLQWPTEPLPPLTVYLTSLPGGAVLRSVVYFTKDAQGYISQDLERLLPYAAATVAKRPVLLAGTASSDTKQTLIVAHPSATTCLLTNTFPGADPIKAMFAGGIAVAEDVDVNMQEDAGVELFDARGRRLGSALWFEPEVSNPLANFN